MNSELESLLSLQEKDRAVAQVRHEMEALEPELLELDAVLGDVEQQLEAAQKALEQAGNWRQELEGKIEGYKLMQERKRQKLEWVRGAKEASAIMAELDLARSVLAKEEAEWIRSADRVQEAEAMVEELQQVAEKTRDEQAPRRQELQERREELERRLSKAETERDEAKKDVSRQWLTKYERIMRGNSPMALYAIQSDACGHCYTAVPMHLRQQIKNDGAIISCEACGVLLYSAPEPTEEAVEG